MILMWSENPAALPKPGKISNIRVWSDPRLESQRSKAEVEKRQKNGDDGF